MTILIGILCWVAGFDYSQILAVSIFAFKTLATLLFWKFRLPFAFVAVFSLMALKLLDVAHLIEFASFDVILFLIGMMTIIGFLEENHFFEYLINRIIKMVGERTERLIVILFLMSAISSALVDEVTSILFMTATILHLTADYDVNPLPFIMMTVFATNIGSSATVVGNPVGVMIALKGELSFSDFLRWATPISVLATLLTLFISTKIFSKDIKELNEKLKAVKLGDNGNSKIYSEKKIRLCLAVFALTILSLIFHRNLEELLHLEKNTMLLGLPLFFAGVSLFLERDHAQEIIERRVDWWTLIFFAMLFASVGTLKYVGVTQLLARGVASFSMGSESIIFVFFTLVAGILSAFMDNVLAVATLIPVVQDLGAMGIYNFPLWWGALFAGTFFGNLTFIGSTANIIAIGMLERRRKIHITFMQWLKIGVLVTIPTIVLAIILLLVQFPYMPR
jgi:Na+/H+ antiporter NhaD/arsenite permease-like protein